MEKKEEELCLLWKEHEHLYNANLEDYRRNDRRQASVRMIAARLELIFSKESGYSQESIALSDKVKRKLDEMEAQEIIRRKQDPLNGSIVW